MKTKRHSRSHLTLPVTIIFSLCLQTSANHTNYSRVRNETWNPITQTPSGSQNITEVNTSAPPSIHFSSKMSPFEMQTSTLQSLSSTMAKNSTPSPARSAVSGTGGPRSTSKPKSTMPKETCEDDKSLILICFIIIAALVLICTFLFLSTVVMANKISHLRKSQRGKRRPRSNGDILATNSLWPTAAGTWQRMPKDTTGIDSIRQDLISERDAAKPRKIDKEITEKLTTEIDDEQEYKEPKSHKPILTNFVVEI